MAQKITDPYLFLKNLVSKKGKSDLFGVYLSAVNIVADAKEDYGHGPSRDQCAKEIESIFRKDENDWNRLLVDTRLDNIEVVHPIAFYYRGEPVNVFFIIEDHEMSCMVCIPRLVVDEFAAEIAIFQQLLSDVASFAGKTATTIKFCIGVAAISWEDLAEEGYAEEVTVGF